MHSISSLSKVLHVVPLAVAALAVCAFARPVSEPDFQSALRAEGPLVAQAPVNPDPYGIDSPAQPSTTPVAPEDTTPAVTPPPVAAPVVPVVPVDSAPRAPRPRITRETTINPMDVQRGSYRNPKKALFMSLVVPGLGQAYIGQSAFTYARGAAYFATDVALGLLLYNYTVVKYDRQVKNYRAYADENWSMKTYEDSVAVLSSVVFDQFQFERFNPARGTYCAAVQPGNSAIQQNYLKACIEPYNDDIIQDYQGFAGSIGNDSVGGRAARRAAFPDPVVFYEAIGANKEFIFGWSDAQAGGAAYNLTDSTIVGSSAQRDAYNSMRQKAKDYSRMQTWFIGGIVLNHIASAVDAAITARRHNRILYQGEARWYDRVNLDGGMAFDQGRPRTQLTASLTF